MAAGSVAPSAASSQGGVAVRVAVRGLPPEGPVACLFGRKRAPASRAGPAQVLCRVPAGAVGFVPVALEVRPPRAPRAQPCRPRARSGDGPASEGPCGAAPLRRSAAQPHADPAWVRQVEGLPEIATGLVFQYVDPPALHSVVPSSGPASGGTQVLVAGSGLDVVAPACLFGPLGAAAARVVSSTQVACMTPAAAAPGAVQLWLRHGPAGGGQGDLSASGLEFLFYPATAVASL